MEACPDTSMSKGKAFQVLPVKLQFDRQRASSLGGEVVR